MQFDQLERRQFITLLGGVAACGARAATGDANHRLPQQRIVRRLRAGPNSDIESISHPGSTAE